MVITIITILLLLLETFIETTEYTISEVCYKVGFSSPSYFTKCFKDYFEFLPTEVRDNIK